ncbi:hypothetical protein B9W61_00825 [Streptomyces sp. CS057]|nr:hypothetical protein B9W61_00825 [Streptomyces sp. CS057]
MRCARGTESCGASGRCRGGAPSRKGISAANSSGPGSGSGAVRSAAWRRYVFCRQAASQYAESACPAVIHAWGGRAAPGQSPPFDGSRAPCGGRPGQARVRIRAPLLVADLADQQAGEPAGPRRYIAWCIDVPHHLMDHHHRLLRELGATDAAHLAALHRARRCWSGRASRPRVMRLGSPGRCGGRLPGSYRAGAGGGQPEGGRRQLVEGLTVRVAVLFVRSGSKVRTGGS